VSYAQALAEQPGKSIPELFLRKYDIDATYEFLDLPEATPDAIQAGHRRLVWAEMRTPGRYLLFEDTTYVSYSHRPEPIVKHRRSCVCQSASARIVGTNLFPISSIFGKRSWS
jgi:hypothetical protein